MINSETRVINSDLNRIVEVVSWLKKRITICIANTEKLNGIELAIQEALTNAIVHGNNSIYEKEVEIKYTIENETFLIDIKDEGAGLNDNKQDISLDNIDENNILDESGRGIMFMKYFCDEVKFDKNKIELLIKLDKE